MKISDLEKAIALAKKEGYKYFKFGHFSNESFECSSHDFEYLKNKVFIRVFNYPSLEKIAKSAIDTRLGIMKAQEKVKEGIHWDTIECQILSYEIIELTGVLENGFEVIFNLKPIGKLPLWYNKDDYYDDFESVDIRYIFSNMEYIPIPKITDHREFDCLYL